MFCVKCGAEIPKDATFCSECGAEQKNAVSSSKPNKKTDKQIAKKESYNTMCIIGFVLSILSFVSLGLGLIFAGAGLIVCAIGISSCNKTGERGKPLAIAGIMLDLFIFFIFVLSRTSLW